MLHSPLGSFLLHSHQGKLPQGERWCLLAVTEFKSIHQASTGLFFSSLWAFPPSLKQWRVGTARVLLCQLQPQQQQQQQHHTDRLLWMLFQTVPGCSVPPAGRGGDAGRGGGGRERTPWGRDSAGANPVPMSRAKECSGRAPGRAGLAALPGNGTVPPGPSGPSAFPGYPGTPARPGATTWPPPPCAPPTSRPRPPALAPISTHAPPNQRAAPELPPSHWLPPRPSPRAGDASPPPHGRGAVRRAPIG